MDDIIKITTLYLCIAVVMYDGFRRDYTWRRALTISLLWFPVTSFVVTLCFLELLKDWRNS